MLAVSVHACGVGDDHTLRHRASVCNVEVVLPKMAGEVCDEAARGLYRSGLEAA